MADDAAVASASSALAKSYRGNPGAYDRIAADLLPAYNAASGGRYTTNDTARVMGRYSANPITTLDGLNDFMTNDVKSVVHSGKLTSDAGKFVDSLVAGYHAHPADYTYAMTNGVLPILKAQFPGKSEIDLTDYVPRSKLLAAGINTSMPLTDKGAAGWLDGTMTGLNRTMMIGAGRRAKLADELSERAYGMFGPPPGVPVARSK